MCSPPEEDFIRQKTGPLTPGVSSGLVTACLALCFFAVVGFGLRLAAFHQPMIYDSKGFILDRAHTFAKHDVVEVIKIVPVRPLFMVALYGTYRLGGMDPFHFRFFATLVLAAAGTALVVLMWLLLQTPASRPGLTPRQAWAVAVAAGSCFVVHPVQTFVSVYIWQQCTIYACCFYFAAMAVYVAVRLGRIRHAVPAYALVAVLFVLAMLSKEPSMSLPVVLLLTEAVLFPQDLRQLFRRALTIALITAPGFMAYAGAAHYFHGTDSVVPETPLKRLLLHYEAGDLTPWQMVLTECRVAFQYLRMIIAPPLDGVPLLKAEVVSRSLLRPPVTALAFGAIAGLWVAGLWSIRKRPLIAFGVLFALVTAIPEATMVPLFLFFGYRPILPMPGLLLILAVAAAELLHRTGRGTRVWTAVVVGSLLVLWPASVSFLQAWRWEPVRLWADLYAALPAYSPDVEYKPYIDISTNYGAALVTARKYPEAVAVLKKTVQMAYDPRLAAGGPPGASRAKGAPAVRYRREDKSLALVALGNAYNESGDLSEAIRTLREAVELDPALVPAHNTLGITLAKAGRLPEAAASFRKALELDSRSGIAYKGLGSVLSESGDLKGAIANYRMAVELDPRVAENYVNLGVALEESGNLPEAMDCFRKAVASDPGLPIARANLGHVFEKSGNMREATQHYRAALELDPESPQTNYLMANVLRMQGRVDQAVLHYRKALKYKPDFLEARANLGLVMLHLNKVPDAIANLTDAVAADPRNVELYNALGEAYAKKGDAARALEFFKKALELDPANAHARSLLEQLPKPKEN